MTAVAQLIVPAEYQPRLFIFTLAQTQVLRGEMWKCYKRILWTRTISGISTVSDDTKTLKTPPATKAHQLVMCFGADLKSNKHCANCSLYTNPTQGNDITYPLRSNTLMQESHLQIPENIWCKRNFNFICSQPAEEMQLSRIVLFRTASHFKCSLLYIGQHSSAKSRNHQSPKWNSQHTKPSWGTFVPSLVWPSTNLVRSSDFVFLLYLFSGLVRPLATHPGWWSTILQKFFSWTFQEGLEMQLCKGAIGLWQRGNLCWNFLDVFIYKKKNSNEKQT